MEPQEDFEPQREDLNAAAPIPLRLEHEIEWYDRKAGHHQRWFKSLKLVLMLAAGAIPVMVALGAPRRVAGALGSLIVVLEGIQQLFQFQQNWLSYRSTCSALEREKFLYLAAAGPYARAERPQALLAERVEGLVLHDDVKWVSAPTDPPPVE